MSILPYSDRMEAGRLLADLILRDVQLERPVVLALPRGGVAVGFAVSERLGAPLDVIVVRKLGVPGHEELAMGAIASGGTRVLNEDVVRSAGVDEGAIECVAAAEQRELDRRERAYREARPPVAVAGRQVILVDDGLATGATMRAAALAVRNLRPAELIVATPVGAAEACTEISAVADRVVCAATPEPFYGVGAWYEDFRQTTDEDVRRLLGRSWHHEHPG